MDDLLREFVGETLEMMEAVAGDLVAWEADPSDRTGIDRIFRTIHTVKGSSGFFDLPRIGAVSHAAEELLDALRERRRVPDRESVATVLAAFERIRTLTHATAEAGQEPAGDDSALIAALLADVRGRARQTGDEAAAAPEPAAAPLGAEPFDAHGDVPKAWRSVRLPVGLLDELMNGVSDLVLARNEVAAQLRTQGVDPAAIPAFERLSTLLASVRSSVGQMRMVPLRTLFAPLPRLVRQLADELGKDVRLESDGGEVEIDREVGEALRDPMVHVLRNAIDHGIEPADARTKAGKSGTGRLHVSARQADNRIIIAIEDDGAGIAVDHITERAIAAGVITREQAATLTPARKAELIFAPGLSTAAAVTGISGRGVGMDVVKANVERLGGFVHLQNRPGKGLVIEFDVPMTLTIISALAIDAAGQSFAMPRSVVAEVLLASSDSVQRQSAGGAGLVRVRGRMLPMLVLEDALGLPAPSLDADEDRAIMLCRLSANRMIALDVPDVRDHEELVIKPLPPVLLQLGIYSGMSLPDSGQPMLLLDAEGIAQRCNIADCEQVEQQAEASGDARDTADSWLLFRPYGAERMAAVAMPLVERLLDVPAGAIVRSGGRMVARVGDGLLPFVSLAGDMDLDDKLRLIRLVDGGRSIVLPASEISQMVTLTPDLPGEPERMVLGLARFGDEVVEMVDGAGLIAAHAAPLARTDGRPVWLVDSSGSRWTRSVLLPILTAAGYAPRLVASRQAIGDDAPVLEVGTAAAGNPCLLLDGGPIDPHDRQALDSALGGKASAHVDKGARA